LAVLIVNFVDRADVRMIQRGSGNGFPLEAAKRLWVFGYIVRQELQGYKPAELDILSLVNHTHPSASQLFDDVIM